MFTVIPSGKYRDFPHPHPLHTCLQPPPSSTSPTRVGHLLQARNLHGHVLATQRPELTLGLPLGVAQSLGLHTTIVGSHRVFSRTSTPPALQLLLSSPPGPSTQYRRSSKGLQSSAFSKMVHGWCHTAYGLLPLSSVRLQIVSVVLGHSGSDKEVTREGVQS